MRKPYCVLLFLFMLVGANCSAPPSQAAEGATAAPAETAASAEAASSATAAPEAEPVEPPIPPGYKTSQEVMVAVATGQEKLVQAPELPDAVEEIKNVEYRNVDGKSLQLDLYIPKGLTQPVPALVFIHGGGWSGGERGIYKAYTIPYAEKGYVTATISYRLADVAKFPAAVQDAKAAIRFLRANADKYHIDPEMIAAIGGSAGGHLSMMLGYANDNPELEPADGPEGVSSRVQAVVNFYGPTDLTTDFARDNGTVTNFIGKSFQEAPEAYSLASPISHLTLDDPPTLIFHGTIDDTVPIEQAELLAAKLNALRIPYVYEKFEGWPHTMDLAERVYKRTTYTMDRFLAKHLPLPGQAPVDAAPAANP